MRSLRGNIFLCLGLSGAILCLSATSIPSASAKSVPIWKGHACTYFDGPAHVLTGVCGTKKGDHVNAYCVAKEDTKQIQSNDANDKKNVKKSTTKLYQVQNACMQQAE